MVSITSTQCDTTTLQENTADIKEMNITLSEVGELSIIDISVQDQLQDACPGLRLKEPVRFDSKLYICSNTKLIRYFLPLC